MQIRVIKADGQVEPYLHTKVLRTFHNALAQAGDVTLFAAEQMAEAVTYYLYRQKPNSTLTVDEIHLMIQSVLSATGFVYAAEALNRHRLRRQLNRRRIEIVGDTPDADQPNIWSKSRLAASIVRDYGTDMLTARAIATSVEEKVLVMNVTRLRKALLRQLILNDLDTLLEARRQLEPSAV